MYRYNLTLVTILIGTYGCGGGVGTQDSEPDPILEEFPIAYVARDSLRIQEDPDDEPALISEDIRNPSAFNPGSRLMLRDNALANSPEQHLFATKLCDIENTDSEKFILFCNEDRSVKDYDVKNLSTSYDGQTLLFSVRAPDIENADDDEQPTWDIWQYNNETQLLSNVMSSPSTEDIGDELSPSFLPSGRILFTSSLQLNTRALLLDEGKSRYSGLTEDLRQHAFNLHTMDETGGDIQQISFNPSHELDPSVLSDGRIVFSRWDNFAGRNRISLYTIYPDGSNLQVLYGIHSHQSGSDPDQTIQFMSPLEISSGQVLALLKSFQTNFLSTEPVLINTASFTDNQVPLPSFSATTNEAQTSINSLTTSSGSDIAENGRIVSLSPLEDGRLLMIWSPCRLEAPVITEEDTEEDSEPETTNLICSEENLAREDVTEADPTYGIWMLDPSAGTRTPILLGSTSVIYSEVVAMQSRTAPAIATSIENNSNFSSDLAEQNLGAVHIRSVYDIDGVDNSNDGILNLADPAQSSSIEKPLRFLRVIKAVPIPDRDTRNFDRASFGTNRSQRMREIIGYTPIEPDGSAKFAVPANVAFSISLLDESGQRTSSRHQNWLQVTSGEVLECRGCHASSSATTAHGRPEAEPESAHPGAPSTGLPYPNTKNELFANQGESMAEVYARINGIRRPTTDEWTDTTLFPAEPDRSFTHADLDTANPISSGCFGATGGLEWGPLCRIKLHYPTHIQPIWDKERTILDTDGITLIDIKCTNCHNSKDVADVVQVPAGQLNLISDPSNASPIYNVSYLDLLRNDFEEIILDGVLTDQQPVLDADGNQVILDDGNGNLIPQFNQVTVRSSMSPNGATSSSQFFDTFTAAGTTVDHRGYLTNAELRIIREWLDIGGQYYNDPFDAPLN